ncbi:MAG: hypothetical protein KDA59_06520, partial [Planctomycetales bacterium]|nr:hypothetical protein [Planctomycetales bacterium]
LTVANPLDGEGTGQFPRGTWQLDSTIDLNNPLLGFTKDGLRRIYITGEDVAGNITPDANADLLNIFLDTQGPQVTAVRINSPTDGFDLFDPKRPADGTLIPTPLVNSIVINVRDLPNRSNVDPNFLYAALYEAVAENPGHFSIVGDNVGVIPVTGVDFVPDQNPATAAIDPQVNGQPAVGYIVLHFSLPGADGVVGTADDILNPLPDDRYTLSISDLVVDPVGNALDGETDPVQPHEDPTFPSGDIVPGGDFVARFTVDTRPEMGVWAAGTIWVDTNGNYRFDNDAVDFVNRDITYGIGFTSDDIFAGNFSPTAASLADGFDKIAAYGFDLQGAGGFRWLIDLDNNGTPDAAASLAEPNGLNGTPVAGNFDGIGAAAIANGDEVSVFDGVLWRFDTNHDFQLDLAATLNVDTQPAHAGTGLRLKGFPITGDFDGDGRTDLATWTDDYFRFDLSSIGGTTIASLPGIQGRAEVVVRFGFTGVREVPVAADLNFDGLDDVGLWTPDRAGLTPDENGEFYWIVSDSFNNRDNTGAPIVTGGIQNGAVVATTANGGKIATDPVRGDNVYLFSPTPFTNDLYINFGNQYARPIVGNFDPPTALQTGEQVATGNLHTNLNDPLDVNADGVVSPIDAGILINHLNASGAGRLEGAAGAAPYLDVNMDGFISPIDVALVVNHLNSAKPAGEGEAAVSLVAEGEAPAEPLFESATLESVAHNSAITSSVGSAGVQLPLPSEILQPNSALGTPVVHRESTDVRHESDSTSNASLATPASTSSDPSLLASLRDEAFGIESLDNLLDDLALDISHNRQDETTTDELFRQLGSGRDANGK